MTRQIRNKVITLVLVFSAFAASMGLRGPGDSLTANLQVQIGWLLVKAAVVLSFEFCSWGLLILP
jgi:hypothetical protein